ncbi:MAG: alpha/beta-type small acid-soluble spore protein [Clostridia bacterium]|nr:alpha/beta-type small acid-soluble spore protein [Clostridia bacterium]
MANRSNRLAVPESRSALEQFKNEVASSMNINLQQGYNGDISARDAGRIGGQMVKRMIEYAENSMQK